jgi:hypothetical protein
MVEDEGQHPGDSGSEMIPFLPGSLSVSSFIKSKNSGSFWVTVYETNLVSSTWPVKTDGSPKTSLRFLDRVSHSAHDPHCCGDKFFCGGESLVPNEAFASREPIGQGPTRQPAPVVDGAERSGGQKQPGDLRPGQRGDQAEDDGDAPEHRVAWWRPVARHQVSTRDSHARPLR